VNDHAVPSVAADYVWPTASHDVGKIWHEFYFGSSGFTYDTDEYDSQYGGTHPISGICGNGYYLRVYSNYFVDEHSAHTFTISNAQTATTVERGSVPSYPADNSDWLLPEPSGSQSWPRTRTLISNRYAFTIKTRVQTYVHGYLTSNVDFDANKWELYACPRPGTGKDRYNAIYKIALENGTY
jgi:hypothetical protein